MLLQLLLLLLIAGVCGSLGQAIGGYSHGGCLVSIALGFIGALLGTWLAGALHLRVGIVGQHDLAEDAIPGAVLRQRTLQVIAQGALILTFLAAR